MSRRQKNNDPFAAREAEKYEKPIASREYLLEVLAQQSAPMTHQQLVEHLLLQNDPDAVDALQRRLRAMERDGQIVVNRRGGYGPVSKMDLITGYVIGHADGFGFLVPDDGSDDLFLSAKQMRGLMHRDRIVACVAGLDRRGRREGSVVEVLERNTHQLVGRFHVNQGAAFLVPDNKRISHEIIVPTDSQGGARDGQIVLLEIVQQPESRRPPLGRVVEVLGDHMAPGMEIDVALHSHEIPHKWPEPVLDAVARLQAEVPEAAKKSREDIRALPLVTIDGPDSKDYDDAVFCEPHGRGWRLLVAIADVGHYVTPGTVVDDEARERGNSVYFPGRVIPMLPEVLSNGLCSLNPEVDRLCMVCEMQVTPAGKVRDYRFFEGVMRSHARLVYDDVAAMLDGSAPQLRKQHQTLFPYIEHLQAVYQAFATARGKRGAIDFETTETRIVFGTEKKIDRIVPTIRNDAHRLIEECMIAANVAAADFLARHELATLYRIHDLPKAQKLTDLRAFLGELGLKLGGGEKPQARHYAVLLQEVSQRPDARLIQTVMLRSLNQAVYSPDNLGHFGLALDAYAHFTSPIRRYPDLLVHRGIRHILRGGKAENFKYEHADMLQLGEHTSFTERRADEATRDVTDWLKCEYMMDRVGESFPGIITAVTSFGLFVELDDIYVEGLVHVTSLKRDYYHFDPVKHRLVGERTHQVYRLADKVRVRLMRVDLDERKIDFELDDADAGVADATPAKGKRRSKFSTSQQPQPDGKKSRPKHGRKKNRRR